MARLHPTFQEPDIQIDATALDSWKRDQLENADALLTAAIPESRNSNDHVLASRALVRARLRLWDAALVDAEEVLVALFSYIHAHVNLPQGHQNPAIRHWPHCKVCSARRQWGKAQGLLGLRHRIRTLPFIARYLYPSHQGLCFLNVVSLNCSYRLGCHHVYGRRTPRRDITRRRPHRYSPF